MKDEYFASMYARTVLKEMGLRIGMRPDQIKEKLTGRYPDEELMYEVVAGIVLSGYLEYRQVYLFSSNLIEELEGSSLDFCIRDLHMPFESFFIDLKNYTGTLGGKKLIGVFIRNVGTPDNSICFELLCLGPIKTFITCRPVCHMTMIKPWRIKSRKYMADILAKDDYTD